MKPRRAVLLYDEIKLLMRVVIQSKILTLSDVVSSHIQSTETDRRREIEAFTFKYVAPNTVIYDLAAITEVSKLLCEPVLRQQE